ncbi:MAG: hypothetical protein K1X75_09700 [Leptospirales bacterium]|nr:hypothetical protein [Leptospirales bacterium]
MQSIQTPCTLEPLLLELSQPIRLRALIAEVERHLKEIHEAIQGRDADREERLFALRQQEATLFGRFQQRLEVAAAACMVRQ